MNRARYRAWDKHTKVMSYWVNIYSDNDKPWWVADVHNPENGDTMYSFDESTGVLMQCTGIKDKNEKLVWEGDILEWTNHIRAEIFWSNEDAGFLVKTSDGGMAHLNPQYAYNFAVVGNIYDNKL